MSQLNDIETEIVTYIERQFQNIRRRLQPLSFGNVIMKKRYHSFSGSFISLDGKEKLK
jgi:hypothetical protein